MNRKPYEERPYRQGVGMLVLNRQGLAFAGLRVDQTAEAWQLPQGGIDPGEAPRDTAVRELAEETGIETAEIVAESRGWLTYDLPREIADKVWQGRYRGQTLKFFAFRFLGDDGEVRLDAHEREFAEWRWVPVPDLPALIVPFKRTLYEQVVAEFGHLARPI